MSDEMKAIIMERPEGKKRRIEIPVDYKITFGAVCPGSKYSGSGGHLGWCLRVYKSKENPVAVFTDVVSFREESLSVREQVTRSRSKRLDKHGRSGSSGGYINPKVTSWVDPDNPDDDNDEEEFLRLPANLECEEEL